MRRFLEGEGNGGLERVVFCSFLQKDVREYERLLPVVFPPTEGEIAARKEEDVDDGAASTSATAAGEEAEAREKGNLHKAQADDEVDEDWETVEKPSEGQADAAPKPPTDKMAEKDKALKSTEQERKAPVNMLQKDW